jgi:hypothetical protein
MPTITASSRRSSMIQEIPLKYSDKVVVNNGDDSQSPLASPSKPSAAKELIRTLVVFASMFVVFLLKGNTSLFRFNTPCRISLLREIDRLQHDLESFERLKKQYVDEEVQLQWDKQHILESEDIGAVYKVPRGRATHQGNKCPHP